MKPLRLLFRANFKVNYSKVSRRSLHEKILLEEYSGITENNIKDYLNSFSVPFKDGYTCFHVGNCFCNKCSSNYTNVVDVFINKKTGYFLCKQCKIAGNWNSFRDFLAKSKSNESNSEDLKQNFERYDVNCVDWVQVEKNTEVLHYMTDRTCCNILSEFGLTPCSRSSIEKLSIRINSDKSILYFPLICSGSVVGYKTFDKSGEENIEQKMNSPGLLTYSRQLTSSNHAVIVANIPDFLALVSLNLKFFDIICLPYSTAHLPQITLPFLEKYKKVILWLGEKSLDAIGNIAKKFQERRCYIIRPIGNQKSASFAVSKDENIFNILSSAKLTYHQFVTTFSSLRDDVLAELQNLSPVMGVPWKRFPQLTNILKGHRRGELTILTGPTGVGKTTFLSEYSLDLAMQGVYTLWGSFEIKNTRLAKTMLTQFAKAPLSANISEFNLICDKFEKLPIFFLTFHGSQPLNNVMDALHHCSYTYDIAHVLIDNIQFMMEVSPDSCSSMDRFWRQDYLIQIFRSFASKYNCHVTLVMHPKKTDTCDLGINSIFGGAKASQEADNVMIIQSRPVNGFRHEKFLEIAKNRYSGDLGVFPLRFDKQSQCFSIRSAKQDSEHEFQTTEERNEDDSETDLDELEIETSNSEFFPFQSSKKSFS